jgi:hypothetical protein
MQAQRRFIQPARLKHSMSGAKRSHSNDDRETPLHFVTPHEPQCCTNGRCAIRYALKLRKSIDDQGA